MIIKAIDPNKLGNVGLINHEKIRNRQFSSAFNLILKEHLERSSLISLNPRKAMFTYTDVVTGHKVDCGLIKLWFFLILLSLNLLSITASTK